MSKKKNTVTVVISFKISIFALVNTTGDATIATPQEL